MPSGRWFARSSECHTPKRNPCAALAHAFYEAGAYVVLSSRGEDKLNAVKDNILAGPNPNDAPEPFVLPLSLIHI